VCSLSRQVTTAETELGRAASRHQSSWRRYRAVSRGTRRPRCRTARPGPQEGVSLVARSPRVVALAHRRAPPRQPQTQSFAKARWCARVARRRRMVAARTASTGPAPAGREGYKEPQDGGPEGEWPSVAGRLGRGVTRDAARKMAPRPRSPRGPWRHYHPLLSRIETGAPRRSPTATRKPLSRCSRPSGPGCRRHSRARCTLRT
jgi:hypothetical protein